MYVICILTSILFHVRMHVTQTYTYFGMHTFVAIERADTADSNEEESEDNDNEEEEDDEEDGSHLNPILVMVFFIVVELFWFRGGIFIAGPHCSPVKGRGGRGGVRKPLLCVIFEPLSFVLSLPADPAHNLSSFVLVLSRSHSTACSCVRLFEPSTACGIFVLFLTHTHAYSHIQKHTSTHTHTHTQTHAVAHTQFLVQSYWKALGVGGWGNLMGCHWAYLQLVQ